MIKTLVRDERGVSLVVVVASVALLTTAGIVLLKVSQGETRMNTMDHRSKQVFYLAESGVEKGRDLLRQYRTANHTISVLGKLQQSAGTNGAINVTPDALSVVYDSSNVPTGISGAGDDVPLVPFTAFGNGWYAAYLTNDVAEDPNGRANATTDVNKRVMLVGIGVSSDHAVEMTEAVVDTGPDMPTPPAAITILGDSPHFDPGSSAAMNYVGDDCWDPDASPPGKLPGISVPNHSYDVVGVTTNAALTSVQNEINGMPGNKPQLFETGNEVGPHRTGGDTAANITTNPYYIQYPAFQNCPQMLQLGDQVKALSDLTVAGGTTLTQSQLGTATDPKVVVCTGNCTVEGNTVGYGVLWVEGTLEFKGSPTWYGQIYVVGKGEMLRSGGGNDGIFGSIIIANTMNGACNGPSAGGFGPNADYNTKGSGSSTVDYCSYYNNLAWASTPVKMRSFRQR